MNLTADDTGEIMDEYRCFWEYCPVPKMPKSFLMSGKRREAVEIVYKKEDISDSDERDSPFSGHGTPSDHRPSSAESTERESPMSYATHSKFFPSAESAFNKIHRGCTEPGSSTSPHSPPAATSGMPGLYPGLYPSLLSYPFGSLSGENGGSSNSVALPYLCPPMSVPSAADDKKDAESPDKSMFYYVDPRIPFTNYFLNLTRLLNNNNNNNTHKSCSATTPLGKMTGDETRADDREPPVTPDSPKSTILSPDDRKRSRSREAESPDKGTLTDDMEPQTRDLPGKLNIQTYSEQPMSSPFGNHFLSIPHPGTMLPIHGGGIFHPAMMHMQGATGYRRFNPEKPPPVKKYKCDVCGKAFSRSNTLVTHKRIHTGDKPFKCEICSRAFRQPGNLTRHRLTHTTVKPYVCPTCNKAFNRASNLHTHMRTHTSFKAFVCPYCGKGFHQKIDMKIHCYTHTSHTNRVEPPRM